MAIGQDKYIANLTSREIACSHWMLVEEPVKLMDILGEWIEEVCLGGKSVL